jgi:hypothetical protein
VAGAPRLVATRVLTPDVIVLDGSPVDLADRVTGSDDPGAHPHPAQPPQGNVLGPPMVGAMPGMGMRPPAGGLPLVLPGPNGLHGLGQGPVSPAAMSAAAAR